MSPAIATPDSRVKLVPPPPPPPRPRIAGTGDPACDRCYGGGTLRKVYSPEERRALPRYIIPELMNDPCPCTQDLRLRAALDRAGKLGDVAPASTSILAGQNKSLWVRASADVLRAHLARVLRDAPHYLRATRMVTDADLLDAQLSWTRKEDDDDKECQQAVDLYRPPGLLVIVVGLWPGSHKTLREVVLTAVQRRTFWGKTTWVVDDPARPLRKGHPTYSPELEGVISPWPKVDLRSVQERGEVLQAFVTREAQDMSPEVPDVSSDAQGVVPTKRTARIHPDVLEACAQAGVKDPLPQEGDEEGGAEGTCPRCGGLCSVYRGRKDRKPLIKCKNACCGLHKAQRVEKRPAKREAAGSNASTSCGPKVQAAIRWLRAELARGPRPRRMLDELRDHHHKTSTGSYYRALEVLGVETVQIDQADHLRLPAGTSQEEVDDPAYEGEGIDQTTSTLQVTGAAPAPSQEEVDALIDSLR